MNRFIELIKMLENDPNDSFLQFALAKEYEKKDDYEEAINIYKTLIENDPNYTGAYYHLAKAYEIIQELRLALNVYEDGINKAMELKDMLSLSELNSAKQNLMLDL